MAWESQNFPGEPDQLLHPQFVGDIEPEFGQSLGLNLPSIPPLVPLGHAVDGLRLESERLADVAQGTSGPVRDDGPGEGRAVTAILSIQILDDFLPALVLVSGAPLVSAFAAALGEPRTTTATPAASAREYSVNRSSSTSGLRARLRIAPSPVDELLEHDRGGDVVPWPAPAAGLARGH